MFRYLPDIPFCLLCLVGHFPRLKSVTLTEMTKSPLSTYVVLTRARASVSVYPAYGHIRSASHDIDSGQGMSIVMLMHLSAGREYQMGAKVDVPTLAYQQGWKRAVRIFW